MWAKEEFPKFIKKLVIQNEQDMLTTFKGIVKKLNQIYWNSESEDEHAIQVGSYGRATAINGSSDLDILFILPDNLFKQYDEHENNGQSALLQDVRKALLEKYPDSDIRADGQVVKFNHSNYIIEIVPCFQSENDTYFHADTNDGGSWIITDPHAEIKEIDRLDQITNGVLRDLCKKARAWKNRNGVPIGGFLIDTLGFNFLTEETNFHKVDFDRYAALSEGFFNYLAEQDEDQEYWLAPGSKKRVYRKNNFIPKSKKARNRCQLAIERDGKESARTYWKRVFGRSFPNRETVAKSAGEMRFDNTEEFIEDRFPISIQESLIIDGKLRQDGFRPVFLRNVPILKSKYSLDFFIDSTTAKPPFNLYWKVLNIGSEAEKRNMIRGQILPDNGKLTRTETSTFKGEHIVEAYIVKNGFVIARDTVPVNIDEF